MKSLTKSVLKSVLLYSFVFNLTAFAHAAVESRFDTGNDGWQIVDFPYYAHYPIPATSQLDYDAASGLPAGSVRVGDVYGETGISAPAKFVGNKGNYYGGSIRYDILIRFTDGVDYPAVSLNDGVTTLFALRPSPPLDTWHPISIKLVESEWLIVGQNRAATKSELQTVLSNLKGLYIATEWRTGPDDTSVDNVVMSESAPPLPGDIDGNGCVDDVDLFALTQDFLSTPGSASGKDTDLDNNGTVDDFDLFTLTNNFLQGC